jgi:ABC-type uncharacterized transport system substrate-binding protein
MNQQPWSLLRGMEPVGHKKKIAQEKLMKGMNVFRRVHIASIILLIFLPVVASAHPHLFITSTAEFVWDKAQIQGCYLEWTFDQFFSADLIHGFDKNHDGTFSEAEMQQLHDHAFIYLKHYYYFTFIRQGKSRTNPPAVSRFTAVQKDNRVSYRFYVDLSKLSPGEFFLAVYDYTFFCDVSYPERNPVKLTFDPAFVHPSCEIVENKNYPVYYDPLGAVDDTTVYYKWRKGLQIYYPREIRIFYEK